MSVPERLVALLADLGMGGRVYDEHEDEHDVTGETAGLGEENCPCRLFANLTAFDIEHIGVCGGRRAMR